MQRTSCMQLVSWRFEVFFQSNFVQETIKTGIYDGLQLAYLKTSIVLIEYIEAQK